MPSQRMNEYFTSRQKQMTTNDDEAVAESANEENRQHVFDNDSINEISRLVRIISVVETGSLFSKKRGKPGETPSQDSFPMFKSQSRFFYLICCPPRPNEQSVTWKIVYAEKNLLKNKCHDWMTFEDYQEVLLNIGKTSPPSRTIYFEDISDVFMEPTPGNSIRLYCRNSIDKYDEVISLSPMTQNKSTSSTRSVSLDWVDAIHAAFELQTFLAADVNQVWKRYYEHRNDGVVGLDSDYAQDNPMNTADYLSENSENDILDENSESQEFVIEQKHFDNTLENDEEYADADELSLIEEQDSKLIDTTHNDLFASINTDSSLNNNLSDFDLEGPPDNINFQVSEVAGREAVTDDNDHIRIGSADSNRQTSYINEAGSSSVALFEKKTVIDSLLKLPSGPSFRNMIMVDDEPTLQNDHNILMMSIGSHKDSNSGKESDQKLGLTNVEEKSSKSLADISATLDVTLEDLESIPTIIDNIIAEPLSTNLQSDGDESEESFHTSNIQGNDLSHENQFDHPPHEADHVESSGRSSDFSHRLDDEVGEVSSNSSILVLNQLDEPRNKKVFESFPEKDDLLLKNFDSQFSSLSHNRGHESIVAAMVGGIVVMLSLSSTYKLETGELHHVLLINRYRGKEMKIIFMQDIIRAEAGEYSKKDARRGGLFRLLIRNHQYQSKCAWMSFKAIDPRLPFSWLELLKYKKS